MGQAILRVVLAALLFSAQAARARGVENSAPAPGTLTLADAVELALAQNDRLIGARDNVEQADLGVRLARSAFMPKLVPNILGSFGQSDAPNQTYRLDLSQRLVTGTELRASVGASTAQNQVGKYYNSDVNLYLSQPLLRGLGRSVTRRALSSAETRLGEAKRQRALSEMQVTVDVAGAYYRVVAQKRLVSAAEKSLERGRQLLEASQAKLGVGKVSQLDVYRAQQLAAQAEVQLLDAQSAVEGALDALRTLLGRDADFVLEVVDDIPRRVEPITTEQAVKLALERRPELLGAEEALVDAERVASASRNQLLPQLDLNLGLTRRDTANSFASAFKFSNFQFATFLAISAPQDRSAQQVEYHNALIERDRRKRDIDSVRRRIVEEARRAVRFQDRMIKSLEVADASVGFAEREVEVASLRYQRGLSNNLDVVNAEGNLLAAQSRRLEVLAELAVARLALRATLGILDSHNDVKEEPDRQ